MNKLLGGVVYSLLMIISYRFTGAPTGNPIELEGIQRVFNTTSNKFYLDQSNIGHNKGKKVNSRQPLPTTSSPTLVQSQQNLGEICEQDGLIIKKSPIRSNHNNKRSWNIQWSNRSLRSWRCLERTH
ncbi:hypothetical protein ACTA71_009276 [Dictyostelium dimigraforme]